jgi:hypothetical protein
VNSVIFGQIFLFSQSGYDPQGWFSQIWLQAKYESKTSFIKSHFFGLKYLKPWTEKYGDFSYILIELWLLKISISTWF